MVLEMIRSPRKNAWFIGKYARNPSEEDFGVFIRVFGEKIFVKTTWEKRWRKTNAEELINIIHEVYEEIRTWQ